MDIFEKTLEMIILEERTGDEPLDGDQVERLAKELAILINTHEGNCTHREAEEAMQDLNNQDKPRGREFPVIVLSDDDIAMAVQVNPGDLSDVEMEELSHWLADNIESKIDFAECLRETYQECFK